MAKHPRSGPTPARPPTPPELDAALCGAIRVPRAVAVGDTVSLDGRALQQLHLRQVNVKEAFTLVDDGGTFFRASLKGASDREGHAEVYERMVGNPESPARITLVCAVLSRQRMLTVVQKATELGCVRIVPVLSDHSVPPREMDKEKPWAWQGQALRAVKQCRRAVVPPVLETVKLDAALSAPYWTGATLRFSMDDRGASSAPVDLAPAPSGADYVLAVGPEGGWSDGERARIEKAGARPLALGTRVLRAETAVLAGLAVLQHRLGDLR